MPIYNVPRRGVEYIFPLELVSQSTGQFQVNPTLAAGDFKISKDFGALANLATLPTVEPAGGRTLKVTVSAAEMTADNIKIIAVDAAGDEWDEVSITIQPSTRNLDDLAFPTTSGRSIDVSATGEVEANMTQIDGLATNGNNATLNLKKLNIVNNAGDAFVAQSTGGGGNGAYFQGNTTGHGIDILGGSNNDALRLDGGLFGGAGLGIGSTAVGNAAVSIYSSGGVGVFIGSTDDDAIQAEVFSGNGDGLSLTGLGTGKSINAPQDIALPSGDLDDQLQALPTAAENATATWASGTRTLTSFGTLVADIWALAIETGYTAKQSMRLMLSALAGKLSGAATTTVTIRSATDAKDRIVATVDESGNRTAVNHDTTD